MIVHHQRNCEGWSTTVVDNVAHNNVSCEDADDIRLFAIVAHHVVDLLWRFDYVACASKDVIEGFTNVLTGDQVREVHAELRRVFHEGADVVEGFHAILP